MTGVMDTFRNMGQMKLIIMTVVGVAMLGFFVFLSLRITSPALTPIYSGLTLQDSSKIVSELEKQGVPYELRGNGAEILVPSDKMLRLRMSMAEVGLPTGGSIVGYEIFDKSEALGTTNAIMNINMLRALEGEIARTISSFSQVEKARVHLVMPKQEIFSREKQDASASVALKLRGAGELSKQEVTAVTHFVAAAVPGLRPSRITVVDSYGRMLAKGGDENSLDAATSAAEEHRIAFERRTIDTVERLVEQTVGPGKVKVQVSADIDFDRKVMNIETFDPESQVARSTQSSSEKEDASDKQAGGAVSAANNLPNRSAAGEGDTGSKRMAQKSDETTNFEISKTTTNHVSEGGRIKKLSVAVLVDGNYTRDKDDNLIYSPRLEEEMKKIESLVKSAIGFDDKRGDVVEVVNMKFTTIESTMETVSFIDRFKHQMEGIIQTLIIAGVSLFAILVVLRPAILHLIKTVTPSSERAQQELAAIAGPAGLAQVRLPGMPMSAGGGGGGISAAPEEEEESMLNLDNISGRVKSSSLRKINEFIDKHPEEAMNVIRQWMFKEAS